MMLRLMLIPAGTLRIWRTNWEFVAGIIRGFAASQADPGRVVGANLAPPLRPVSCD